MIETIDKLKEQRPDLFLTFEAMTHEQLLNQIYLEVLDCINMEERVATFMAEATNGMSYTTYTPGVITQLVQDKWEHDLSSWCKNALEDIDGMDLEGVKKYLKSEVK